MYHVSGRISLIEDTCKTGIYLTICNMYHVSGRISLIEGNAESFRLKSNLKKVLLQQLLICPRPPSLITVPFSSDNLGRYIHMFSPYFLSYFSLELPFKKDN
jgi:hypothetical protein